MCQPSSGLLGAEESWRQLQSLQSQRFHTLQPLERRIHSLTPNDRHCGVFRIHHRIHQCISCFLADTIWLVRAHSVHCPQLWKIWRLLHQTSGPRVLSHVWGAGISPFMLEDLEMVPSKCSGAQKKMKRWEGILQRLYLPVSFTCFKANSLAFCW